MANRKNFVLPLKRWVTTPLPPGDTVHIVLPTEGVDEDFRILSTEYNVDAKKHVLETVMELGRKMPLRTTCLA